MSSFRSHLPESLFVSPEQHASAAPAPRAHSRDNTSLPAVVLVGGEANALSVARELGRQGITVFAIAAPEACVRHSRYCQWVALPRTESGREVPVIEYLLSPQARRLRGSVLLACSDASLKLFAEHREQLCALYKLDLAHPPAQLAMLDKLRTYQIAHAAGVATPRFWAVRSLEQVEQLRRDLVFPLMIKPRLSHLFEQRFGRKHIIAADDAELHAVFASIVDAGLDVMLVEVIPGPDDRLSSYFTYIDDSGKPLCHYTKRVVRRYPAGMGATCYHITGDVPEIIEPSVRLLAAAGVRGIANVEFKYDQRDQRHKLIECNARFVASNALVAAEGLKLATFIYNRAIGRPAQLSKASPQRIRRMWDPIRDFAAFLELRRTGKITLAQWLASVMHRQSFPYFAWNDPAPTLFRLLKGVRRALPIKAKG